MHSYHNVAELRQFRGALAAECANARDRSRYPAIANARIRSREPLLPLR